MGDDSVGWLAASLAGGERRTLSSLWQGLKPEHVNGPTDSASRPAFRRTRLGDRDVSGPLSGLRR